MKRELKQAIGASFNPPEPQRKQAFIDSLELPTLSLWQFFLIQLRYIRKRVWLIETALVACCLVGLSLSSGHNTYMMLVSILSSSLPFVALVTTTEIARSISYNMAEIEMTTRYSLSQLLITRMIILGITNLLNFLTVIAFLSSKLEFGFIRLGLYLLVPYLLTCFGLLLVLNKVRSSEANYYCAGISGFVSICYVVFINSKYTIYSDTYVYLWVLLFATLIIGITIQLRKNLAFAKSFEYRNPVVCKC